MALSNAAIIAQNSAAIQGDLSRSLEVKLPKLVFSENNVIYM